MEADHNLVLKNLRKADQGSLKLLFDQYYEPLVKFANAYLFDAEESKDIVQGVFITLWEKRDKLKISTSVHAYLFKAVKNRCLNRLKKLQVTDLTELQYIEALLATDNEQVLYRAEEELRKAIANLPAQVRRIIEMRYTHNKRIKEISAELDLSENTVKTQLQRGKTRLKQALGSSPMALGMIALCLL